MNVYKLLSFFDQATKEQLAKVNKLKFVGEDTDFTRIFCSIIRRRLNMYTDEQAVYDVALEAFSALFLTNLDKLKYFSGRLGDEKISIESYLYTLYDRKVIDASKARAEAYKAKQNITPIDGESAEDAFNRVIGTSRTHRISMGDIYEIEYLESKIAEAKVRIDKIQKGEVKVVSIKRSVDKLNKDIEKDEKYIRVLKNEGFKFHDEDDDGSFTVDEENQFEDLIKAVKEKLPDSNLTHTIFNMQTQGFRQAEIAEYFDISKVKVSKIVSKIKEAILEVAQELNEEGEPLLFQVWKEATRESNSTSNTSLDFCPTRNLNRQVYMTFGYDLQDDVRHELY